MHAAASASATHKVPSALVDPAAHAATLIGLSRYAHAANAGPDVSENEVTEPFSFVFCSSPPFDAAATRAATAKSAAATSASSATNGADRTIEAYGASDAPSASATYRNGVNRRSTSGGTCSMDPS